MLPSVLCIATLVTVPAPLGAVLQLSKVPEEA
jgi:hypothetical protein